MIVDAVITDGKPMNYRWYTSEGKIVGSNNLSSVKVFGAGIYSLEITDNYGCTTTKDFRFPIEVYQIIANPDYASVLWAKDTTINVLENDQSSIDLMPGSVHVIEQPTRGEAKVNTNGSITYISRDRGSKRDKFVYEVCNTADLCASATVTIDILDLITTPEGLSPNGDGVNEVLKFKGLENYPKSELYIYTRAGQLVYQSLDYQNDWGCTTQKGIVTNPELVPTGTYYYILKPGGTSRILKGFVYIAY